MTTAATAEPTTAPPADAGTPPASPATTATGTPPDPAAPAGDSPADLAALRKELDEARREAAKHRTAAKRYEDAENAAKQAQMSEVEKLQAQLADLQKGITERDERLKAQELRSAVQQSASKLGFVDADVAVRLLDPAAIEYTEDGRPRNLDHLLGAMLRERPYLKASYTQPPDLGQGNRGSAPGTLTRADLEKMTTEQVMALPPAEVDAALKRR